MTDNAPSSRRQLREEAARAAAARDGDDLTDLLSGGDGGPSGPDARRSRSRARRVALIVAVVLAGTVAAGAVWAWATYEQPIRTLLGWQEPADYEPGEAGGEALVTIAAGDTGADVSAALFLAGVTRTETVFYDMLIASGADPAFYPGVYRLQQRMTAAAALAALQDPAAKVDSIVQLREGMTVEQSLQVISDSLGIPVDDLRAAVADPAAYGVPADSLEGWLFPATYTFDPGVTAPEVVHTMVDRTVASLDAAGVPPAERQRILTIASIIQREAREDDFAKVSRVIANRLGPAGAETSGLLQMDSTAQYGYGEMHDGTASSSAEALADDNPWNTYVHPGLPAGPIANPGDAAIDAAMHPADGPWLYFVTVNLDTGETVFSTTAAEHEAAVARWQQWCADNPESGC
jgi:UPF0755 protein